MITKFRIIYNSIDSLFDRSSISKNISFSQELRGERGPKTAIGALHETLPAVRRFDRKSQLKRIVSQPGIDDQGMSPHWEFFFDLLSRRAQLLCEWKLIWDEKADTYGPPRMEITIRPFPPAESPLRQMVRDGHLLHRQLIGLWLKEARRLPTLPNSFRDTNLILADFKAQGLDTTQMEFSLCTSHSPERGVSWMAQTRDKTYYTAFL